MVDEQGEKFELSYTKEWISKHEDLWNQFPVKLEELPIQDLDGRVENLLNAANISNASTSVSIHGDQTEETEAITPAKKRRIKLPEALKLPLPVFDGKYENWLSF
ncbi:unnamed protein product [Lasius platythorax]|uniref:Uncharacterized protein n=1 Tax=Lasius platythorax TaxID=488582 RepID=A0AAV2NZL4_9HYME